MSIRHGIVGGAFALVMALGQASAQGPGQGSAPGPASAPRFPHDMTWVAESLAGKKFAAVYRPTLRIAADGKVNGSTGCNRYAGMVALFEGQQIGFGPIAMTRMACFGAGGENERMFAPAIGTVSRWRFERRMLVLETASGPLRFRRR